MTNMADKITCTACNGSGCNNIITVRPPPKCIVCNGTGTMIQAKKPVTQPKTVQELADLAMRVAAEEKEESSINKIEELDCDDCNGTGYGRPNDNMDVFPCEKCDGTGKAKIGIQLQPNACTQCHGARHHPTFSNKICTRCGGTGTEDEYETCTTCDGRGVVAGPGDIPFSTCLTCAGDKMVKIREKRKKECIICEGTGETVIDTFNATCKSCNGTGYKLCKTCKGKCSIPEDPYPDPDYIPCPDCEATGHEFEKPPPEESDSFAALRNEVDDWE